MRSKTTTSKFNQIRDVRAAVFETSNDNDWTAEEPWKAELLAALAKMPPQKFEMFSRGLLINMGVNLNDSISVYYVGDGGLDGFGYFR